MSLLAIDSGVFEVVATNGDTTQHQVKIEIESFYEGEDFSETSLFQKNSTCMSVCILFL